MSASVQVDSISNAAGMALHRQLIDQGYKPTAGPHYVKGADEDLREVDLLVPQRTNERTSEHGGRTFDVAPGRFGIAERCERGILNTGTSGTSAARMAALVRQHVTAPRR